MVPYMLARTSKTQVYCSGKLPLSLIIKCVVCINSSEKVVVKIEQLGAGDVEQVNILTELTVLQSISHGNRNLVQYYGAGKLHKSPSEAKVCAIMK